MTLSARVQKAGNAQGAPVLSSTDLVDRLRADLQRELSTEKLAALACRNPEQARNEVRSACRMVFLDPSWETIDGSLRDELVESLLDTMFGFGVLEDLIADESITEVMVNGVETVFFEKDGFIRPTNRSFSDEKELRALIDRILGPVGRRIDESSPMVNARLPQGHRVNIVIPPIALDGPCITIRKFSSHVITLEEMEAMGSVESSVRQFLIWAVRSRKNIAVSGGTGSGKTRPQHKRYRL